MGGFSVEAVGALGKGKIGSVAAAGVGLSGDGSFTRVATGVGGGVLSKTPGC